MKFRGICEETGEWVIGIADTKKQNIIKTFIEDGEEKFMKVPVEPRSVGAYVGIRDSFDNELFEGDIIEIDSFAFGGRYVITWDAKCLRYIFLAIDGYLVYQDFKSEEFHKIGCIYE